jgi:hypothetical protein
MSPPQQGNTKFSRLLSAQERLLDYLLSSSINFSLIQSRCCSKMVMHLSQVGISITLSCLTSPAACLACRRRQSYVIISVVALFLAFWSTHAGASQ